MLTFMKTFQRILGAGRETKVKEKSSAILGVDNVMLSHFCFHVPYQGELSSPWKGLNMLEREIKPKIGEKIEKPMFERSSPS